MKDLEEALGQFVLYEHLLRRYEPERKLYLAVPEDVRESVFEEEAGQVLNKNELKTAIVKVLQDYLEFLGNDPESEIQLVIDENQDHYLLVETGWHQNKRIYGTLIHLDIISEKVWIQQDGTEEGIANELTL